MIDYDMDDELLEFACDLAGFPPDTHALFGNSGEEEDEEVVTT